MRGIVDTLVKVIAALEADGIELIGENMPSTGQGRGVRLMDTAAKRQKQRPLAVGSADVSL
jgi:hypothetical protein